MHQSSGYVHPMNTGDDKRNLPHVASGFSLGSVSYLAALSLEETFTEGPQSVSISWINIH